MLISLTGPQGSGKSTLISDLVTEYGYQAVERKTARSVLAEWGMTLDEIYSHKPTHMRFQDALLERKYLDERQFMESDSVYLTERSYVDLFVYTSFNLSSFNECDQWLNDYYETCKAHQALYTGVVFLEGGKFPVQDDGVRGCNAHYANMIELMMSNYMSSMTRASQIIEISSIDRNARARDAHNQIQLLISV